MYILSENDTILALILNRHLDKKAMKKYLIKLSKRCNPRSVKGVIARMLDSKDYWRTFDEIMAEMDDVQETATEFYRQGNAGLVLVGNELYPVKVDIVNEDPDEDMMAWSVENERLITYTVAQGLTDKVKTSAPRCTVILFKGAGYSGVPFDWVIQYGRRPMDGLIRRAS